MPTTIDGGVACNHLVGGGADNSSLVVAQDQINQDRRERRMSRWLWRGCVAAGRID